MRGKRGGLARGRIERSGADKADANTWIAHGYLSVNIDFLAFVPAPAAADRDASLTVERVKL